MKILGVQAVLPVRSRRDDEIAPESIHVRLLEVHIQLPHHTMSKDGVSTIAPDDEIELDGLCCTHVHWRCFMDRHVIGACILFLPDDMLERSDLTSEITRYKLMVEGHSSIGLLLEC